MTLHLPSARVPRAPGPTLRSLSMRLRAAACLLSALFLLAACSGYGRPDQASSQLAFGVDMARRGLWDEALFRFHEAERLDPQNARIQSNLGVASEAAGQFDKGFKGDKTAKTGDKAGAAKPPAAKPGAPPRQPGITIQPTATPEPSTPEDAPPPPADNRPPR